MDTQKYPILTKTVKVSDPYRWYGQKQIEIKLMVTPEYKSQADVRILAKSIDDFMMYHAKPCFNDDQLAALYKSAKTHMYDTMPRKISVDWLLKHGYDVF